MIDDVFVIDAVAHGYNLAPANQVDPCYAAATSAQLYGLAMQFVPEGYLLPYEEWSNSADPDLVASALFAESPLSVNGTQTSRPTTEASRTLSAATKTNT